MSKRCHDCKHCQRLWSCAAPVPMNKEQAQDAWSINHDTHADSCACFEGDDNYEVRKDGYTSFSGGCAYCDWLSESVPTYPESQALAAAHALECDSHPHVKRIAKLRDALAEALGHKEDRDLCVWMVEQALKDDS